MCALDWAPETRSAEVSHWDPQLKPWPSPSLRKLYLKQDHSHAASWQPTQQAAGHQPPELSSCSFDPHLCHSTAVCSWAGSFTSLSFSGILWKTGQTDFIEVLMKTGLDNALERQKYTALTTWFPDGGCAEFKNLFTVLPWENDKTSQNLSFLPQNRTNHSSLPQS